MIKVIKTAVLMAVIISALAAVGCSGSEDTGVPAPGRQAPDFQLETLDGEKVSLDSLHGRPVVINFWATWCAPCRLEMPILQQLNDSPEWRTQGLAIVAINIGEPPALVNKFVEVFDISFTVLLDPSQKVALAYSAALLPITYFIDKDGIIRDIKVGAIRSTTEIEPKLKALLAKDEA